MKKVSHKAPKVKAIHKDHSTPQTPLEEMNALDIRIALIQALIPLGLDAVAEEFREALRVTIQDAGHLPPTNRKLHLIVWCHKVLRKAQDEIDRLFGT